jgi:hypothetical protein
MQADFHHPSVLEDPEGIAIHDLDDLASNAQAGRRCTTQQRRGSGHGFASLGGGFTNP